MTGSGVVKTEAVVLRAMRYGESDKILHLYTPDRGRISAIAKGARKPRSRFGGRLEPFFRLDLVLRQGRGDLLTVAQVATLKAHHGLLTSAAALDVAGRDCDAVARLFGDGEPHPPVYHLLCNALALLDAEPRAQATAAHALAFRAKLLLAAGFAPQLGSCASCGESDHLAGFSGAAGGVVCTACEAGSFALGEAAHAFLVGCLGAPLARVPAADTVALHQAERALLATLEHHAGIRLARVLTHERAHAEKP